MEIGVIGLGGMGTGMASRLLDQGHTVRVWNRTAAAADGLVGRGAVRAATPADATPKDGVVISMVANDAALEAVTTGEGGLLGVLGGGVHMSMGTVSAGLVRALAERHAAAGSALVSAPVFGRPDAAASGNLRILLSGSAAAKESVRPVVAVLSVAHEDLGEAAEAAALGKIAGNFLIAAALEAMSEAFVLLEKSGVDARAFHRLLAAGPFACPIYANYGKLVLDGTFSPPGFKLALGAKDVGLASDASAAAQVPMPLASLLRDRHLAALAQGRGELDWTAVSLGARADAGLS